MRKILFKYLLLTALAIFLFLALTSCNGGVTPETGNVTITIVENITMGGKIVLPIYYIYMDDVYQGTSIDLEPFTLDAVPVGVHTFTASNYLLVEDSVNLKYQDNLQNELAEKIPIPFTCYGSATHEIITGINYVTIHVDCGGAIY
ncbi:hypothetical protein ES705_49557 [subsurface metagenome]